jgi:hypothetical protein
MNQNKINEYIKKCHELAESAGWWDDLPYVPNPAGAQSFENTKSFIGANEKRNQWLARKIDLIAGEGAEAVEALRKGRRADRDKYEWHTNEFKRLAREMNEDLWEGGHGSAEEWLEFKLKSCFEKYIKDSFSDEIADIFIRTCDLMGFYGLEYNEDISWRGDTLDEIIRVIRIKALGVADDLVSYGKLDPFEQRLFSDILFMCLKIAELEGFDLEWHVEAKVNYNSSRGYKHGKNF